MFKPLHTGLYFGTEAQQRARQQRARGAGGRRVDVREPLKSAWVRLDAFDPVGKAPLEVAQWGGLVARLDDDAHAETRAHAAQAGIAALHAFDPRTLHDGDLPLAEALASALLWAQCLELLRDALPPAHAADQHAAFAQTVAWLDTRPASFVETLSRAALHVAAGVVLEDAARLAQGAEVVRQTVREDVHPSGYLPKAVEGRDGGSLRRQLQAVQALTLAAEAALHAGERSGSEDLWAYNARGVSIVTAATYTLYYYFYPDKWRWDAGLDEAQVKPLYQAHGGYLEIVNHHAPLHDYGLVLKELRPVWDVYGGGLVTLTHALPRRGWFG